MSWLHVKVMSTSFGPPVSQGRTIMINTAAIQEIRRGSEGELVLRMLNQHEYVIEMILEYGSFPPHFQALIG